MTEPNQLAPVSVVIVSYNTREKLARCLSCLDKKFEIVVVDNASGDGSPEMVLKDFSHAKLIRNQENLGFGAANNVGAEASTRELVLYLNSDAYAHAGAVETLAETFSDSGIVCAGGMLLNPDGSIQDSSANALTLWAVFCEQTLIEKIFPWSRVTSPYWNTRKLVSEGGIRDTTQVMGAAMMCRRGQERFDERYFLYCEDTDLCARLSKHGRIVYVPDAKFTHDLGSSSNRTPWKAVARYNRGKELYFLIHKGKLSAAICLLLNRLGALARLSAWLLCTLATLGLWATSRAKISLFARVLSAPLAGPTRS